MPEDLEKLKQRFDGAMLNVYTRAKSECGYPANRFYNMLHDHRGYMTAKLLLADSTITYGLVELALRSRLDISMEQLVLLRPWNQLFTEAERTIAVERLKKLEYTPKIEPVGSV